MIKLFEVEASKLLGRVGAAVQSSDADQLRIAAHALRGLIAAFSSSAAKAAEVLERLAIDGRVADIGEKYQALYLAVQNLRAVLPTLTIEKLHGLVRAR